MPVTPPFVSFFKQTTYNRWRKRHDDLVSTLILTHCDPPLKNPGYAPGYGVGKTSEKKEKFSRHKTLHFSAVGSFINPD